MYSPTGLYISVLGMILGMGFDSFVILVGWGFCSFIISFIFWLLVRMSTGSNDSQIFRSSRVVSVEVCGHLLSKSSIASVLLTGVCCTCTYGVCSSNWCKLCLYQWSLLEFLGEG